MHAGAAVSTHEWSVRADLAEAAVVSRHLRRVWGIPGTLLGVVAWPPSRHERMFLRWDYWWQAHLIDCAVDAAERSLSSARRRRIVAVTRTHRLRNLSGWTNNYYDDMAWLGLALERAQRTAGVTRRSAIEALEAEIYDSWAPERGGGIPWRRGDDFFNTPANGPGGILLARTGKTSRAQDMADWIDATLVDPKSNLVLDGIHTDRPPDRQLDRDIYTYCQGVVLGLETELAVRLDEPRHARRVHRLVQAVAQELTDNGVVKGGGGGDGGLFNGILVRYLALTAVMLPGNTADDIRARDTAADIVLASASAAWHNRRDVDGQPLWGRDWAQPAALPAFGKQLATFTGGTVHSSDIAERDYSVQLSGWMLMEAACVVSAAGYRPFGSRQP